MSKVGRISLVTAVREVDGCRFATVVCDPIFYVTCEALFEERNEGTNLLATSDPECELLRFVAIFSFPMLRDSLFIVQDVIENSLFFTEPQLVHSCG